MRKAAESGKFDTGTGGVRYDYMAVAMEEAKKAGRKGEVPIGAVIVCRTERGEKIIARAHNVRERRQNALAHAEIIAIDKACRKLHSWRLDNCMMYVTLEPCPMCAGAALNARLKKVIAGAKSDTDLNWKTPTEFDLRPECSEMIKDFFKKKR